MTKPILLIAAQRDAAAITKKLESIRHQVDNLPSFKGKAALMDKAISAWNRAHTLTVNIKDELYNQRRGR